MFKEDNFPPDVQILVFFISDLLPVSTAKLLDRTRFGSLKLLCMQIHYLKKKSNLKGIQTLDCFFLAI